MPAGEAATPNYNKKEMHSPMKLRKLLAGCTAIISLHSALIIPSAFAGKNYAYGEDDAGKFRHVPSSVILPKVAENNTAAEEDDPIEEVPEVIKPIHNPRFANDYIIINGIDVSKYQTTIDWEAVADDGIQFAIIRLGFRGYGEAGTLVEDNYFRQNYEGAKKAGLDVGVYFFTQAITVEEAVEEANFVLETLQGASLDTPVYLDVESISYDTGRLDSAELTQEQITENCDAFCETIENAGYEAGIYANMHWLNEKMNSDELERKYRIWLANYKEQTPYEGEYHMWQYTSQGTVAGISGSVDMNVLYSRKVEFANNSITLDTLSPVTPDFVGDGKLTFTSSDKKVALVDKNGCITPINNGTVTITASSDNGTKDSIEVTINASAKLTLNHSILFMTGIGTSEQFTASGTKNIIYWMSDNENVATVTGDGLVETVGYGNATITAMDIYGNRSTCKIYVTKNPVKPGDCNADGTIDAMDAAAVLAFSAANGAVADEKEADSARRIFDVNQDSAVDAMDASAILFLSANSGTSGVIK